MRCILVLSMFFGAGALLQAANAVSFFVATNGSDGWSGRLAEANATQTDGPFASVHRALAAVRADREAPKPNQHAMQVIEVRGGTYFLDNPIRFEPEDSQIILRAYPKEQPLFSGGQRLTEWEVGPDGRWRTQLKQVRDGDWSFIQLFVNNQRRSRPYLPETGYYKIAGELPATPEAEGRGFDRFEFHPGEIREDWANLGDVEVLTFHSWSMSRLPIQAVDGASHAVRFFGRSPSVSWWGRFPKGNRYRVENVKEALRRPGQWYLDRPAGELTYVPLPAESPGQADVIAPRLDRLVVFAGEPARQSFVTNVWLQGLTFAHANWTTPRAGQSIPQAEINLDGAISATGARGIVIERCAVRHVGAYAVAFGLGCKDNRVEDCDLIDLGAGGIKIGAAALEGWGDLRAAAESPEPLTSHHQVRDCTIAFGGRLHPAAIGVWIGHSPYNVVEHNDIYDFYYSATSIGWIWGYRPSHAHHNRVAYNHMHTLGQGVLSDMGAVYTLGVSPGTVVSHNHIHDVHAFDYGGWGLYTDEGSTGVVMENNLVYRTKTGNFHQHYGRDNHIVNNILALSQTDQLQRTRVEEHVSFVFERNIVLYDRGQLMGKQWADDKVILDRNLYWNMNGEVRFPGNKTLQEWRNQTSHDSHSQAADPLFMDPRNNDFRLQPGSPALDIGFVPFDVSAAGRRTASRLEKIPTPPAAFE